MLSPLMILTLSYIIGVLLSPFVSVSSLIIFAVILLFVYVIRFIKTKNSGSVILLVLLMLLLGGIRYFTANKNLLYDTFPDKYVTVSGTVSSLPSHTSSKHSNKYTVSVDTVTYLDKRYKINKKILLHTKESFDVGDIICASGFLTDFPDINNEFEYNFRNYYKSIGIYADITALEIEKTGELKSYKPSFLINKAKYKYYERIQSFADAEDIPLISCIVLGNKNLFPKDYKNLLVRTGSLHILYSQSMHIMMIFLLAALFIKGRKQRNNVLMVVLLLYIIWESSSATAIKAGLAAFIIIFRKQFFGYSNKGDILALVVFIMTAINPMLCFNSGFMLSAISSFYIYFSFDAIYDKLLTFKKLPRRLAASITIWFILSVGVFPFASYYFNGMTPYSIILMPMILPFVLTVILLTPLMCLLPSGFAEFLMPFFRLILSFLKNLPYIIEKLPFHHIYLRTPSVYEIIFLALVWFIFINVLKKLWNTDNTKILLTVAAGTLACILIDSGIFALNISFVNVGQGDAAVIRSGLFEKIVIDGGGSADYQENYNIGESVYLPYLVSHGFSDIDVAILTHYHKDHAEGIIAAMENLKINTLIMPDLMPKDETRLKIEQIAKEKHIKTEFLSAGDIIKFRSGLTLTCIAPSAEDLPIENANNASLVFNLSYGKFNALFTGDYEKEEHLSDLSRINLLKAAHHGSVTGNSDEFLKKLSPEYTVISVGKNNIYNLPDKEVIKSLEALNSRILRTDKDGDIHFSIYKNGNSYCRTLYGGI